MNDVDVADIIAGALQTSRGHAYELMERALAERGLEDSKPSDQCMVGVCDHKSNLNYGTSMSPTMCLETLATPAVLWCNSCGEGITSSTGCRSVIAGGGGCCFSKIQGSK